MTCNEPMKHIPWPSIENFHNLRRGILKYPHNLDGDLKVTYRAKVKIHGTNAGVQIDPDGTVIAQSRSNIITSEADNVGFAAWVEKNTNAFSKLARDFTIVIFGEWCGPGIQSGSAINGISHKSFAVFGMRIPATDTIITRPEFLNNIVAGIDNVYVVPWYNNGQEFVVDWSSNNLQEVLDSINKCVSDVELEDPWALSQFGISGIGEGLVFYIVNRNDSYKLFSASVFKAKGEKHNTVARTRPAQMTATPSEGLLNFVDLVLTDNRLKQGVEYASSRGQGVRYDIHDMSTFLRWINEDLIKETSAELAASNLTAKEAYKACMTAARSWYMKMTKKL